MAISSINVPQLYGSDLVSIMQWAQQLKATLETTLAEIQASERANGSNITTLQAAGIKNYTVATLPASAAQGAVAYATNGRNSGEGAGTGTGCLVARNSTPVWAAVWSGVAVTA